MQLIGYEHECRYRYPVCYRIRVIEDGDMSRRSAESYWLSVDEREVLDFFKREVDTCLKADCPVQLYLYRYNDTGAEFTVLATADVDKGQASIAFPSLPPQPAPTAAPIGVSITGNTATITGGGIYQQFLPFPHP